MTHNPESLITARTDAGMTQRELADAMDVSQPFVAAFESGRKRWPDYRVTQALECVVYFATQHSEDERESYLGKMRCILDRFNAEGWPA